jgi:hypothetical protein
VKFCFPPNLKAESGIALHVAMTTFQFQQWRPPCYSEQLRKHRWINWETALSSKHAEVCESLLTERVVCRGESSLCRGADRRIQMSREGSAASQRLVPISWSGISEFMASCLSEDNNNFIVTFRRLESVI